MINASTRLQGVEELIDGEQYFVIHAARQSRKTTYLKDIVQRLSAEGKYYALYCSLERVQNIIDLEKGIPAIVRSLRTYLKYSTLLNVSGFASNADTDYTDQLLTSLVDYWVMCEIY
jgi:hypothetical protein